MKANRNKSYSLFSNVTTFCIIGTNFLLYDFLDGCEKGEELSCWESTKGDTQWKFLPFKEDNDLRKQIRQQELPRTQTNATYHRILNGILNF